MLDYDPSKEPPVTMHDKASGSTTLLQCGWCEYASGTHRYNYCINGRCALLRDYGKEREVVWNDKCHLIDASQSELGSLVDYHIYKIDSYEASIKRHNKYIECLRELIPSSPLRPPLPSDRKHDHFNIDDEIYVYMDDMEVSGWFAGIVKNGYRHHDGCVSYRLYNVGPQEKGFWGCGMSVPIVLLKYEYEFFQANPSEYAVWCAKAYDKDYNGKTIEVAPIEPKGN